MRGPYSSGQGTYYGKGCGLGTYYGTGCGLGVVGPDEGKGISL
jgi:hypothetical protein